MPRADVPIYIGYLRWSDTMEARDSLSKSRYPPHLGGDEMMPLMFAAGLIHDFDLESIVTILQQGFSDFGLARA